MKQQRLELTWIGKDERPRLEPRILVEDQAKGHRAATWREGEYSDNMLIQGDNLLALKALEAEYTGKIKCVFIDPPYNTGSAFEHFNDGLEHSLWLTMIRDRLELIYRLLAEDGSLWVTLDDNEAHYFKVMCDEVFGRANYMTSIVWEKDKGRRSDTTFSSSHDYIFIYAKNAVKWGKVRNLLERTQDQIARYKNPDGDPRGPWLQGDNGTAKSSSEGSRFPVTLPSGRIVVPPPSRGWSFSRETLEKAQSEKRVYFGQNGDGMPIIKRYLNEVQGGVVPRTWWNADESGHNQEAKRDHLNKLLTGVEPFPTPKPERLIEKILSIASNQGDLVLDSFAGSGTTGAVAHKMGRRWILVELGDHAVTHIVPRLTKVVDGLDPGGVTESTNWRGGGGFRFFHLAPSLLRQDRYGQWVVSPEYQPEMLAEAVCKLMGFTYAPSRDEVTYWRHGHSTESDFIFVTTQAMTFEALAKLSDEVGDGRTLLVACRAFAARADAFPNLTLKKIPHAVLTQCEWGRDDYSLTVPSARSPEGDAASVEVEAAESEPAPAKAKRGRPRAAKAEPPSLFGEEA